MNAESSRQVGGLKRRAVFRDFPPVSADFRSPAAKTGDTRKWSRGESNPLENGVHAVLAGVNAQENAHDPSFVVLSRVWPRLSEAQRECFVAMA